MSRLWFYVPDYPMVRDRLREAYASHGVIEWSAEPGRCTIDDEDADVTVSGEDGQVMGFRAWLHRSEIVGLMVEGQSVLAGPAEPEDAS